MMKKWQPTATRQMLQLRAQLYEKLRFFFKKRQVLEVETPTLSQAAVPTPMIEPFYTSYHSSKRLFLHTSPELPMKRLLVMGYGSLYQIAKVFRNGEFGRWHHPEFTLLEWYRVGFKQQDLIEEVSELLQTVLDCQPVEIFSYPELFNQHTQLQPLTCDLKELQNYLVQFQVVNPQQCDRDACLQLIMSSQIEPTLGQERPTIVTDFPASQAALARTRVDKPELAERFECYVKGVELANGFYELADVQEQRTRFEQELVERQRLGMATYPLDENFLAALEAGLPLCSGVALGIDRLLMLLANAKHIKEVLSFSIENG